MMTADGDGSAELSKLEKAYEILGELSRDETVTVYVARDRLSGQEVAIKVLRAADSRGREPLAHYASDARMLTALEHPNIVAVHSVKWLSENVVAVVTERVRGPSLRQVLDVAGTLPVTRATEVLRGLGRALAWAHSAQIMHRDVRPETVIFEDGTGRVILSDFGLARRVGAPQGESADAYRAPELADDRYPDQRSDVYSLGVVGWELLTGRRPWPDTMEPILPGQRAPAPPALAEVRPGLPPALVAAIEGAVQLDRDRRITDVVTFMDRLTRVAPPSPAELEDEEDDEDAPLTIEPSQWVSLPVPKMPSRRRKVAEGAEAAGTADPANREQNVERDREREIQRDVEREPTGASASAPAQETRPSPGAAGDGRVESQPSVAPPVMPSAKADGKRRRSKRSEDATGTTSDGPDSIAEPPATPPAAVQATPVLLVPDVELSSPSERQKEPAAAEPAQAERPRAASPRSEAPPAEPPRAEPRAEPPRAEPPRADAPAVPSAREASSPELPSTRKESSPEPERTGERARPIAAAPGLADVPHSTPPERPATAAPEGSPRTWAPRAEPPRSDDARFEPPREPLTGPVRGPVRGPARSPVPELARFDQMRGGLGTPRMPRGGARGREAASDPQGTPLQPMWDTPAEFPLPVMPDPRPMPVDGGAAGAAETRRRWTRRGIGIAATVVLFAAAALALARMQQPPDSSAGLIEPENPTGYGGDVALDKPAPASDTNALTSGATGGVPATRPGSRTTPIPRTVPTNPGVTAPTAPAITAPATRGAATTPRPTTPAPTRPATTTAARPSATPPPRPAVATPGTRAGATGAATRAPGTRASAPAITPARTPAERVEGMGRCGSSALADQRACLAAHLARSDAGLNQTYQDVITAMRRRANTAPGDPDPPEVERLRSVQRSWLVQRDVECRRRGRGREGPLWATPRAQCLEEFSVQRSRDLSATLARVRRD